jgi:hypothetical protein
MYKPPTFLTPEVLADVLGEFSWPAEYSIAEDLPDGIEVRLPGCRLYFTEGFESDMDVRFLPESTGLDHPVSITAALVAMRSASDFSPPPKPCLGGHMPHASLDKVQCEVRDLCTLLLTYFRPSLEGRFDWILAYREHARR